MYRIFTGVTLMLTHAAGSLLDRRQVYIRLTVALMLTWLLGQSLDSVLLPASKHSGTLISADLGGLPLSFEPNAGQTSQSVLFTARTGQGVFYFTRSEVVISLASLLAPEPSHSALPLSSGESNLDEIE